MDKTDPFLQTIRQRELAKFDPLSRIFSNIQITATAQYGRAKVKTAVPGKEFKASACRKLFFLLLTGLLFVVLIQQLISHFDDMEWQQLLIYIVLLVSVVVIWSILYIKRKIDYRILVNKQGLTVINNFFAWNDIYATAILQERQNRGANYYLIIVLHGKTHYQKFQIDYLSGIGFWKTGSILSAYIEYFKQAAGKE